MTNSDQVFQYLQSFLYLTVSLTRHLSFSAKNKTCVPVYWPGVCFSIPCDYVVIFWVPELNHINLDDIIYDIIELNNPMTFFC